MLLLKIHLIISVFCMISFFMAVAKETGVNLGTIFGFLLFSPVLMIPFFNLYLVIYTALHMEA